MTYPHVLFLGCDKGAWQMRGVQMAKALGCYYSSKFYEPDVREAATIVLIKRAAHHWGQMARRCNPHARIIWDVLDIWQQPEWNSRPVADVIADVKGVQKLCAIDTLIGATKAMAEDIGGVYIPHHCRLGLVPTPPREKAEVVAYDGSERYLGRWQGWIQQSCDRLGMRFVVNPKDLSQADILVAFRDAEWDGEICCRWKSGVKYVNAMAAGRPIISQWTNASEELPVEVTWVKDGSVLVNVLAYYAAPNSREPAYEDGLKRAKDFTIEAIAHQYRKLLWPDRSVA